MVKGKKIDFYLPKDVVDEMDSIVEEGYYLSRSELIRDVLRHYYCARARALKNHVLKYSRS